MNGLMAKKKSAAAKGFRKTEQKKPFLTKKEIIVLIVILAVVVAAFIVINNLPDGFIGASQVQPGDILAYGNKSVRDRYLKLGTINDLEGFDRTDTQADTTAMVVYTFTPKDENSNINYITVSGSPMSIDYLLQVAAQSMPTYGYTISDPQEMDVQGYKGYVYSSNIAYYEAPEGEETAEVPEDAILDGEEAEHEPNTYAQDITLYVDCENEHTLSMHVMLKNTDEAAYIADDALIEFVQPFTASFNMLPKETEAK